MLLYVRDMSHACYIRFSIVRITNVIGILILISILWARTVAVKFIWRFVRYGIPYNRGGYIESVRINNNNNNHIKWQPKLFQNQNVYALAEATRALFMANHNNGKMVMNLRLLKWIITVW